MTDEIVKIELLGRVRWFNNEVGHGMVSGEDGHDYFLHYSEFIERQQGKRIMCFEGQTIRFVGNLKYLKGPRAQAIEVVK